MKRPSRTMVALLAAATTTISVATVKERLPEKPNPAYRLETNTVLSSDTFALYGDAFSRRALGLETLLPGQRCIARAGGRVALEADKSLIYRSPNDASLYIPPTIECPDGLRVESTPKLLSDIIPSPLIRALLEHEA
jgi:hypothetical protein